MTNYLIISPVKNEEQFIEKTIQSVINQTVLPKKWIIVDDGSTDGTRDILRKYSDQYDFITPVYRQQYEHKRKRGQGVIEAFYAGLGTVNTKDFDYLVKLDGDLILPLDFFEKLLSHFQMDAKLGIASGVSYAQKNGKWRREKAAKGYTFGETKLYKRPCFEAIGGLVPHMGWDGIDHIKAVMLGWNASSFDDIVFYHLRPEGAGTGLLKAAYEEGLCCHYMGYHPLFFTLRACKRMFSFPIIIGGLAMISSYLKCAITRQDQFEDEEFKAFLRKIQINRILSFNSKYTAGVVL